jgi:hypothetical protein
MSRYTRTHKDLAKILCDYAHQRFPKFKFSAIMLNEGGSGLHVDKMNCGPSLIASFGDHTGGELFQYPDKVINIHNRLKMSDGTVPHMTLPFEGERFSVVYFTNKWTRHTAPSSATVRELKALGFSRPRPCDVTPRVDLLSSAASYLRQAGVAKSVIGDFMNTSITKGGKLPVGKAR